LGAVHEHAHAAQIRFKLIAERPDRHASVIE
jgi:hypothetical protein